MQKNVVVVISLGLWYNYLVIPTDCEGFSMEMNRFRTALGGFHRGDVANYIERSSREHQAALQELKDSCVKLTAQRDAAVAELETVKAQLEAALEGRQIPAAPEGDPETLELLAYRRAEAAERAANQRIRRQTEKMDGILESVAAGFDTAKADVQEIAVAVQENADKLQAVLDGLKGGFEAAASQTQALKKDNEE